MKLFDIPIKVHWSTIILLVLLMPTFTLVGLAHGLILFGPVILFLVGHELAHALIARKFGYHTRDITLFALGGVAQIQAINNLPPKEDLWISFAGPAFNVVWAIIFGLLILLANSMAWAALIPPLTILLAVNILLGVFNLIPGFPLDGGRISRALCSLKWGPEKGRKVSNWISRVSGGLMIFAGISLSGGFLLALFGIYICYMAFRG
jgi:Zn-dependent protease